MTLRKLVDDARRSGGDDERVRLARESAYRFMVTLAGDEPGFEEATRALFAGDGARFEVITAPWPTDVRHHVRELVEGAW